jgi:hypothetical protein
VCRPDIFGKAWLDGITIWSGAKVTNIIPTHRHKIVVDCICLGLTVPSRSNYPKCHVIPSRQG